MRFNFALAATLALAALPGASPLRILLGNDDGWAEANIREFYRLLKRSGHDVVLVAPVVDNSGQGGRAVFTNSETLQGTGEFNSVQAGAPSLGSFPSDDHINYYNGTPAACTFVGLDYVLPKIWGQGAKPDLFVSGPNVGTNLGGFLFTLSGTIGSTYAAVGRGIPGIAFSGGSLYGHRSYELVNKTTKSGFPDPATVYAQLSTDLVNQIAKTRKKGKPLFPLGYGLNVNYPSITSLDNNTCVNPKFYQTRITGGAFSDFAAYNNATGVFNYQNILGDGLNVCINGNCELPGETDVVNSGCNSAVSVFTVDYDAPNGKGTSGIQHGLKPLVKYYKDKGSYKRFAAPGPEEAERRHK
ncbi:MAG: hypothetical protein MMC23_007652 [Stictis urceolatum]|nr:hypothetical protein [Stictis urceolata]